MAFVLLFLVLGGCAGKSTPSPRRQTYDSAKILSATKVVRKSKGDRIVNTARSLIDTPYRWGGRSPRTGFDCSGFVWYVFRKHGVDLPRTSTQLLSVGRHVDAFAIRSGDILIYNVSKKGKSLHVAIATGRGTFVHSPSSGKGVSEVSMSGPYWKDRLLDARRVL
jgi:cell wall-associated NlpC family hydrolase